MHAVPADGVNATHNCILVTLYQLFHIQWCPCCCTSQLYGLLVLDVATAIQLLVSSSLRLPPPWAPWLRLHSACFPLWAIGRFWSNTWLDCCLYVVWPLASAANRAWTLGKVSVHVYTKPCNTRTSLPVAHNPVNNFISDIKNIKKLRFCFYIIL